GAHICGHGALHAELALDVGPMKVEMQQGERWGHGCGQHHHEHYAAPKPLHGARLRRSAVPALGGSWPGAKQKGPRGPFSNRMSSAAHSSTTSKGMVRTTSRWKATSASYLPTDLMASPLILMPLRSTSKPMALSASAIMMVLTLPKMRPFSPTLAPIFRVLPSTLVASASASALILASLWARCFSVSS